MNVLKDEVDFTESRGGDRQWRGRRVLPLLTPDVPEFNFLQSLLLGLWRQVVVG